MTSDAMLSYEAVYVDIKDMHQMNIQEELAALQLSDLCHDMTLTDVSRNRYMKALDELKFYASAASGIAEESLGALKQMRLLPPTGNLQAVSQANQKAFGACVQTPE